MNNKKKLAVISLVVMMMITAVGYASFGDSLRLVGSASSAKFDVQYVWAAQDQPDNITLVYGAQGDNANDNLEIKAKNLVPGVEYSVKVRVKNFGTVPAVLDLTEGKTKLVSFTDRGYYEVISQPAATEYGVILSAGAEKEYVIKFKLKDWADTNEGVAEGSFEDTLEARLVYKQVNP